ncbi:hypothetical protein E1176_01505 [Fulvivirga sp. RKSG066]|uniref:hypothetical protein n=1 Tax=Fulvivirga aurantia TaxID=2529383 RepID=UPI0012BD148D|nr:hypothetical protein [Fulvivirga aurantia]MTI19687.1 hypothetical protein [Fulvivirga aurantia]
MKKLTLLCLALLGFTTLFAQSPEQFPYQAIVRDTQGVLLADQNISVQFNIREASVDGTVVYSETMDIKTTNGGIINVAIGTGSATTGTIGTIDWSSNSYFLEAAYDLDGGTNYISMGTTQLVSVPYTLHAKTAEGAVAKTKAQRDAMTDTTVGQMVFCSDCGTSGELQVFNGTSWTNMVGEPASE